MSNVIGYIETIGQAPALSRGRVTKCVASIAAMKMDANTKQALLANDVDALSRSLGGRDEMRCLILTPDD